MKLVVFDRVCKLVRSKEIITFVRVFRNPLAELFRNINYLDLFSK